MATWLSEYTSMKNVLASEMSTGNTSLEQLLLYQEILYRIEVLETCQAFSKTAPMTMEIQEMSSHYQLVDAYIQCISKERRIGSPTDSEQAKARRQTASASLEKTIADCRKRFSSFVPTRQEQYRQSINTMFNTVLPVWLQLRNTYVNIGK